ncbi:MAG: type I-F CRISPR-associated helicase Cas3f [Deltaproteobacteria bacterium]|jgi:CRISPR-associated endonuclease/helicase Cas3|nr:type I-F CRISPR-associated helicase Cas3f [Deltaproteobacteria bacterium]
MNVFLVSQCRKGAIAETRRILDQFAERRGDQVWQTAITQAGLETLHSLLRRSARKNTAVACHWIHGQNRSELLWIVGDRSLFNERGATPTNSSSSDMLRRDGENAWHSLRVIRLLAGLAALLHDLGKACRAFQKNLSKAPAGRNIYRHEWISLRLFQSFVGSDDDAGWLRRLAAPDREDDHAWLARLQKDGSGETDRPFAALPPLAAAIGWLIVSHHRLLVDPDTLSAGRLERLLDDCSAAWNEQNCRQWENTPGCVPYWEFPKGLPVVLPAWRERAALLAGELSAVPGICGREYLDDPFIMHLARLALMLGDHTYSALGDPRARLRGSPECGLYANTDKAGRKNQKLDEHLLGVEKYSRAVARSLPHIAAALPALEGCRELKKPSGLEKFRWQDKAAGLAEKIRQDSAGQGVFIVNMASTGCGKTLANARFMYALADPARGLRCSFALGLRALTRQTGREYRERLHLDKTAVAILAGGLAAQELRTQIGVRLAEGDRIAGQERVAVQEEEDTGSASAREYALLAEDLHVLSDVGPEDDVLLQKFLPAGDSRGRELLSAPILCCTVDHLTPATESLRGGRQILPMLRLLSGDLVLDELDDYDLEDLPALTRLIYWAGLCGCRVLISSATLPPSLTQGMFAAYCRGRGHWQLNRGERPLENPPVSCVWLDEFHQTEQKCADPGAFSAGHQAFVEKRRVCLEKQTPRRKAELRALVLTEPGPKRYESFAGQILEAALALHERYHALDPRSGKKVSFGLARMANIAPLFETALALYSLKIPPRLHVHLCVYHSQFPLLLRSAIEERLDSALNRHEPAAVFSLPEIRTCLDNPALSGVPDHIFMVLGSPVTEVGRDHDYDWAVVEPSSLRSLIQLAGRVSRHREPDCSLPNIIVFDRNLKSLDASGEPAYCRPGFESKDHKLRTHSLYDLLPEEDYRIITSIPRILPRPNLEPEQWLADLEHHRLQEMLLPPAAAKAKAGRRDRGSSPLPKLGAYSCWLHKRAMLSGLLQRAQPFRRQSLPDVDLVLLPCEDDMDGEEGFFLARLWEEKGKRSPVPVPVNHLFEAIEDDVLRHAGISPWGEADYLRSLKKLADNLDLDMKTCALRHGTLTLPASMHGWYFHPALGFTKHA